MKITQFQKKKKKKGENNQIKLTEFAIFQNEIFFSNPRNNK